MAYLPISTGDRRISSHQAYFGKKNPPGGPSQTNHPNNQQNNPVGTAVSDQLPGQKTMRVPGSGGAPTLLMTMLVPWIRSVGGFYFAGGPVFRSFLTKPTVFSAFRDIHHEFVSLITNPVRKGRLFPRINVASFNSHDVSVYGMKSHH